MKYYKSHRNFIVRHFGEKSANAANYGWVVSDTTYLTKVYTIPTKYVATTRDENTKRLRHQIIG